MQTWRCDWCAISKSKFWLLQNRAQRGITAKVFFPWKRFERWTKTEGRCHTGTGRRKPNTKRRVLWCWNCAAQLQTITFHRSTVEQASQCWVCRDNRVNILRVRPQAPPSLTLLLQFDDHLLGFLLLVLDLLHLLVLSVQDLRTDGESILSMRRVAFQAKTSPRKIRPLWTACSCLRFYKCIQKNQWNTVSTSVTKQPDVILSSTCLSETVAKWPKQRLNEPPVPRRVEEEVEMVFFRLEGWWCVWVIYCSW